MVSAGRDRPGFCNQRFGPLQIPKQFLEKTLKIGFLNIIAPPGATFQINVRPPLRMVSGVSAVSAKIAFGQMLVAMVGGCSSGPKCCPSVWEVSQVYCEGCWREIPRPGIGCSSDRSISIVYIAKSPISVKTDQNPVFEQNLEFSSF